MCNVKAGQVWASTHRGDVALGKRQHRLVVSVQRTAYPWTAELLTAGLRVTTVVKLRQRLDGSVSIPGYRLIEEAPDA